MSNNRFVEFIILLAIVALVSATFGAFGGFFFDQYLSFTSGLLPESDLADRNIVRLIEEESSTIDVVDRVAPAVVSIVVERKLSEINGNIFYLEDFFYDQNNSSQEDNPDELVEVSAGTGFIVTSDGYVVTNRHVLENKNAVYTVVTNDDQEYSAEIVDTDPFFDIAILKIDGENFPTVSFGDSDNVRVGQTVIAIGNALSQYQNSVTKGVVSGVNRRISAFAYSTGSEVIEGAIQTDAAINPGNSGGPLINLFGEVIGMNTAISSNGQGLGFAIPINEVKSAVESVKQDGRIVRPWLGVRYLVIDEDLAKENSLSVEQGAWITADYDVDAVVSDSPADKAGLKRDDIIIKVGDQTLSEKNTLSKIIRSYLSGDVVELTVLRDEKTIKLSVTLEEYQE